MEYRRLGSTSIELSTLGFGASPLGGVFGNVTQDDANLAVQAALEAGINYFDTSPFYGLTKSESVLGAALKGVDRSKFIISTKVGRYGQDEFNFSAARVKTSLDESLERLGLSSVDLCVCHDIEFGDINQVISETIPMLKQLQREGKIKHIGVSGLPLELFRRFFEKSKDLDFILSYCHYTMFDKTLQSLWDEKLSHMGIGVINASPLSMGLLTKAGPPAWHPAPQSVKDLCQQVSEYCSLHEVDITELAIQESLKSSFPSSTLVGMPTEHIVRSNVASLSKDFPKDVVDWCYATLEPIKGTTWSSGKPEYN